MKALLRQDYRNQKSFQTYCRFYAGHGWRLGLCVLLFLIKHSPVFVIPILTANIISLTADFWKNPDSQVAGPIFINAIIALVLILQNIPTHILYIHQFSRIIRDVEMKLRSNLCVRLQQLSIHYLSDRKAGELQSKVIRDVENVEQFTRILVDTFPGIVFSIIIAVVVTAIRAPLFILFYMVTIPVAVLLFRSVRGRLELNNRDFRQSIESMSGQVNEMLRLIPITRAHNAEDSELERISRRLQSIQSTGLKLDHINAVFGALNWALFMFFNILTLLAAALFKIYNIIDIEIGDIILLTGYFNAISGSVMGALGSLPFVYKGLESVKSIGEVLECPDIEQNADKPCIENVVGDFVFDNVGFSYSSNASPALFDINLHVPAGETIALVGASGAGKSTLAQLIIGFARPSCGQIRLDGIDMNTIDLRSYRRFISVVTQETLLFDGSIKDNICYGIEQTVSDEQLLLAIKNAHLEDFISSLPEGLNTRIKEGGSRLSGGQKQRIAIARALLRDPKVLILDEATSALDVDSEEKIQKALNNLVKNRTTFIIAHRLSTVRNADRIAVIQQGRIVELGTPTELLAQDGIYSAMHRKFNS